MQTKYALWSMIVMTTIDCHVALPTESQRCKLRNCLNTGQKKTVSVLKDQPYKYNRYMQTKRIKEFRNEKCLEERLSSWEEWKGNSKL